MTLTLYLEPKEEEEEKGDNVINKNQRARERKIMRYRKRKMEIYRKR